MNTEAPLPLRWSSTENVRWKVRIPGEGFSSPANDAGTTFVIKAGPSFERLARNDLGEYTLASPAFSRGELFLRTEHHLYCIALPHK